MSVRTAAWGVIALVQAIAAGPAAADHVRARRRPGRPDGRVLHHGA